MFPRRESGRGNPEKRKKKKGFGTANGKTVLFLRGTGALDTGGETVFTEKK